MKRNRTLFIVFALLIFAGLVIAVIFASRIHDSATLDSTNNPVEVSADGKITVHPPKGPNQSVIIESAPRTTNEAAATTNH